jgi:hypothetical protein
MRNLSLNLVLGAFLAASSSFGANLVSNPDFATGQLNPWVNNGQVEFGWVATADHTASNGCVGIDCVDETHLATASYLYQTLATTSGETYHLSFDFGSGNGTPSELKVLWSGNVVLDLVNAPSDLMQYSVSDLVATSDSTQLMFLARQDPGFLALTNIDVEGASVAPEPATLGLICGGIGLIGLANRFRNRRAVSQ